MIDTQNIIGLPILRNGENIGKITDAEFIGKDFKIQYSGNDGVRELVLKNLTLLDSSSDGEFSEDGMATIKF
jgi:hypothetical protein